MNRVEQYLDGHPANCIRGYDLQPCGFESFEDALDTIDPDNIEHGSCWKIQNRLYVLANVLDQPVFILLSVWVSAKDAVLIIVRKN